MADQGFELDVLRDLLEEARTVGRLAGTPKSFNSAYEAFRSEDRKSFLAVLRRLKVDRWCRLICEWLRVKECVFLCLRLCGPPPTRPRRPDPRALAEAIVRVTSDKRLVAQLARAVEKRDRAAFQRLVKAQRLEPFCHLFCHWVCVVRFRLVCRWLCDPTIEERPNLAAELQTAGGALRALLENRKAFDAALAASQAGDDDKLRATLAEASLVPYCFWICEWLCSWRCVLVCLTLCREFPLDAIENELQEALAFAKATEELAQKPADLERLSAAVGEADAQAFAAIVAELKLQRFCLQLCHWICFLRCRLFRIRICPPDEPWFTHIGHFGIYADIDSGTGLTNKAQAGHGGPKYGFFGCLELRGYCPRLSPTFPGEPLAYRFLYQEQGAPKPTPITKPYVCTVYVTSRRVYWFDGVLKNKWQSIWIRPDNPSSNPPPGVEPDSDFYLVPDPEGWVQVIPTSPLDDAFSGGLMGFASWIASPGSYDQDPAPGVTAGTAVPVANQRNGINVAIIFEATRVSTISAVNGGAAPDYTNQVSKVHLNNWLEVSLLDLQEFLGPGATACSPLTNDLHILYTVDHELLAQWFIDLATAATISPAPTFPSGVGPRGGSGSDFHDITTWPTCSYTIRLHTRRSLTDGLIDDDLDYVPKTFCIGKKERLPR